MTKKDQVCTTTFNKKYGQLTPSCPFLEVTTHQDDEYSWAGVEDPKVVITTSHNPSSRLKQFSKVNYCTCVDIILNTINQLFVKHQVFICAFL